jgi:hypothetical protein
MLSDLKVILFYIMRRSKMLTNDKRVLGILSTIILAGGSYATFPVHAQEVGVTVAVPDPVIAIGFYDPVFGYWTGTGWDTQFYDYGHPGYGHEHYHGIKYVDRGHERDHFDHHGGNAMHGEHHDSVH